MELKEGMYVITTDRLEIGKIIHFCECEMCKERGFYEPVLDNPNMFITNWDKKNGFHGYKFYENLLDLIEVGDYVNGCYVEEVTKLYLGSGDYIRGVETSESQSYGWDKAIPETWIKSIVTKEQFESMVYKVMEE